MAEDISRLVLEVQSKGIKTGTDQLDNLTKAADKAEASVKKLGTAWAQSMASVQTGTGQASLLAGAITALTSAIEKLSSTQVRAARSTQQHSSAMQEAHGAARGLAGSLGALWVTYGNLAGMSTGLAIGAALKGVVSVGSDVEHTLENIRVLGEASTAEIDKMKLAIIDLGKGVNGPKDVAEALSVLTLAGLNAEDALKGVGASLNLAITGGISIEKASSTLVQVSSALGYTADAFDHIGDVIAKTAAVSMSSVDSISGAFKSAASVNALYGTSLTDIGVGLAALANLGIQGTAAGTSLKNMFKDLNSQSEKSVATLKAMGLTLNDLKGADKNFLPTLQIFEKLEAGLKKVEDRQTALGNLFGERGVKAAAAQLNLFNTISTAVNENGEKYANKLEEIADRIVKSYAFTAQGAIAMSQTSTNQFKSIGNTLQVTLMKAFDDLSPKVGEVSRALKKAFESPEFIGAIKGIVSAVAELAIFLAKNADVIGTLIQAFIGFKALQIATAFSAIAIQATAATAATGGFTVAMKAFTASLGPIGLALTALTTAWYAYKTAKSFALQDTSGIQSLKEFTDKLREEDEKSRKSLELRKQGLSAQKVAENEAADAQVSALDKVTKASGENLAALKKGWAERVAGLNVLEKAALKNAEANPEGIGNIFGKGILAQKNQVIEAEKEYNLQLAESKKLQKSLIESSKERAELEDKLAKDASKRESGEAEIGGDKTKGTGAAERLSAELAAIQNAHSLITNEYRMFIDGSKAAAKADREQEQAELAQRNFARAIYVAQTVESFNKEIDAISKYHAKTEAATKAHKAAMTEAAKGRMEDTIGKVNLAEQKDKEEILQREIDLQKKLLKSIEDVAKTEEKHLAKTLLGDQRKLAGIGELKSQQAAWYAEELASEVELQRVKVMDLQLTTAIGISEGKLNADQVAANNALLSHAKVQLELKKQILRTAEDQVKAYQEVEEADRTTKNLNDAVEAAKRFQKSMTDAFGSIGDAIGGVGTAFAQMNKDQDTATRKRMGAAKDEESQVKAQADYERESFSASINGYANMANAAKGFFDKKSAGYRLADGVSKAMHLAEVARDIASIAPKIAAGAATMFAQSGWGGFAGIAAMGAAMAALGFAVSGGSGAGGKSAADVQKEQGTGSVFGDIGKKNDAGETIYSIKSESIEKSLDLLEKNNALLIPINQGMLNSLRAIESSLTGLTNLIVRVPGLTEGTNMNIKEGTIKQSGFNSSLAAGAGAAGALGAAGLAITGLATGGLSLLIAGAGALIGAAVNKLVSLWGKTTQTIVDSGIQLQGTLDALQSGKGFQQYASIDTTKSSFFGISKSTSNRVETQGLSEELNQQFGLIFTNIEGVLKSAAPALGKSSEEVANAIKNFTLPLTKLSLKGLTGDEVTKAINGVISKALDDIAKTAFPGMEKFAQVGEGYSQTVVRVANDILNTQQVFALLGKELDITKSGTADIVESFISISGGLDKLNSTTKAFTDSYFTQAEKLAPLQSALDVRMQELGISSVKTTDQFKALVLSQDLTTEAGQKMYTELLAIAPAFKSISDASAAFAKQRKDLTVELAVAQGDTGAKERATREDALAELAKISPEFVKIKQATYDAIDATQRSNAAKSLELEILNAQGRTLEVVAINREAELDALRKTNPELVTTKQFLYETIDSMQKASAFRKLEIELMQAQGNTAGVLAATRQDELEALRKTNPELVAMKEVIYATLDAATAAAALTAFKTKEVELLNAQGKPLEAIALSRELELEALQKTNPELISMQKAIYAANDATQKAALVRGMEIDQLNIEGETRYALMETRLDELDALRKTNPELVDAKIKLYALADATASLNARRNIEADIMKATGNEFGANALARKEELESLRKTNPELVNLKITLQNIQVATEVFNASMKVVDAALKRVSTSIEIEKDKLNVKYDEDKNKLSAVHDLEKKAIETRHDLNLKAIESENDANVKAAKERNEALKNANAADISAAKDKVTLIQSLLSDIKTSVAATAAYDIAEAHAKALETVRKATVSGSPAEFTGINDAVKELAKPTEQLFSSLVDYQVSQAVANNALKGLQDATEGQLTDAQKNLLALESLKAVYEATASQEIETLNTNAQAQKDAENARYEQEKADMEIRQQAEQDALETRHNADIQALTDILTQAQIQVDKLNGIDSSILSLSEAMKGFASAQAAATAAFQAQANANAAGTKAVAGSMAGTASSSTGGYDKAAYVEGLYGALLNRQSDKAGLDYWVSQLNRGVSESEVAQGILNSSEAQNLYPSFDVGTNELPEDMVANIHKGERIIPAADNAELMRRLDTEDKSPSDNFNNKVDALIDVIMRGDTANVQKTNDMYRILRDWDGNGMPPVRQ